MKKTISAMLLVAMLLSAVLVAIPIGAASNSVTVTSAAELNVALRSAKGDCTINISGTVQVTSPLPQGAEGANITMTGGTLDLSKLNPVYMNNNITFKTMTLQVLNGSTLYANGYDLFIDSDVTMKYVDSSAAEKTGADISFTVYGGGLYKTINGDTNLRLESGIYTRVYGGSNGGKVIGNTNVIIGTKGNVNNNDLVGWNDTTHGSSYQFFGGSNGGVIVGDTNITVGNYAYADYVVGGNNSGGSIGGTANMDFSGYAYGLYGASRGGNTMNDVNLTMRGGGVADIFGGSAGYSLGSAEDPSNVIVKFFGGDITRRIYAGSYNEEYNASAAVSSYVYGTAAVVIGGNPSFSFNHKIEVLGGITTINGAEGIFASSRQNNASSNELGRIIFLNGDFSSQIGGSGFGHNPSTKHKMTYSASGNTITETCSCGCGHTASSTLMLSSSKQFYTGEPIECATVSYGSDWMSGPIESVEYTDNVNLGTATASMTLKLTSDYVASAQFDIIKKPSNSVVGTDPDGDGNVDNGYSSSVEVIYKVDQTYDLSIPSSIVLGELNTDIPVGVSVENMIIPIGHQISMQVASQNGYKVKNDSDAAITYSMKYGETTVTEGTDAKDILTVEWDSADNRGSVELKFARTQDPTGKKAGNYTDILSFTSSVSPTGKIPDVKGRPFVSENGYDQGDGSILYVAENIEGLSEFNAYLNDLEEAGYTIYTGNVIGENHFATLTGFGKIVNVMYTPYYKEIRVVTDLESTFALPGLSEENVYNEWADYEPNLTLISNYQIGWPGRMGYIYQLADGSFFIIDGGYTQGTNGTTEIKNATSPSIPSTSSNSSVPYVMEVLEEYAPDKDNIVIAAWLITHMHEDHFGAFIDLALLDTYKDERARITIEKLIYNQSSMDDIKKTDVYRTNDTSKYSEANPCTVNEAWNLVFSAAISKWGDRIQTKIKAHPGQQFFLRNLTLTMLTSQDLLHESKNFDPWLTGSNANGSNTKYINNTSLVTIVEFYGKKALYMADSSATNNPYVVAPLYSSVLDDIQILQVAHHGYGDTDADSTYAALTDLEVIFWPSNAQHFYGKEIGYIENSKYYGGTKNIGFNQQLYGDGVKIYIHGRYNLTIKDFVNYTPESVPDELQVYDKYTWVPDLNYIKNNSYK